MDNFTEKKFKDPNNSEELILSEIIDSKKITSLKFSSLSKAKQARVKGIKGLFGFKTTKQEELSLVINDNAGIILRIDSETGTMKVRFSNDKDFKKINNSNIDESTLLMSKVFSFKPYLAIFHVENLKELSWKNN